MNNISRLLPVLTLPVLCTLSLAAQAVLIDFESAPLGGTDSYAQDGFTLLDTFSTSATNTAIQLTSIPGNSTQIFAFCAFDGSCSAGTSLALTDGGAFSVSSIDAANWQISGTTGALDLVGHFSGGGSITQTLTTDDFWSTYSLSGFDNLVSLDIVGRSVYAFAIDNLVVNGSDVPEPATLALLGLSMAGLGFRRKDG